jgi:hypothetical protein
MAQTPRRRQKRPTWSGTNDQGKDTKLENPFLNLADADQMSVEGVRRAKAALSSGCKPHPATAPAGSNRSSHGGNEVAEAFD